jgi:hypothetical protein
MGTGIRDRYVPLIETIEMNEPRQAPSRDFSSMVAYAPAGLLVLYVIIRLMV